MYALDTNEARKADSTGSMIKEIGKYVGKITQAEDIKASTGTKGIALSFQSNAGQKTRVSLYTMKADGERIMGYQALMALMTCLSLRNIEPEAGKVVYWDNDSKSEQTKDGMRFSALENKDIGFLLETEDYEKQDGSVGARMVLKGVFQAGTEFTASEILDKKTKPEQLGRMVAGLRHRPLKGHKAASAPAQHDDYGSPAGEDDIPF